MSDLNENGGDPATDKLPLTAALRAHFVSKDLKLSGPAEDSGCEHRWMLAENYRTSRLEICAWCHNIREVKEVE